MRRTAFFLLLVALGIMLPFSSGCSKKETENEEDRPKEKFVGARGQGKGTAVSRGDPLKAGEGIIRGRVVFQGDKPSEPVIATMAAHKDSAVCLAGKKSEEVDQKWLIGDDNGVANVVISLKPPSGKYFEPKEEDKKRSDKVILDQPHCNFVPHVVAAYPSYWDGKAMQPTGQGFIVKNSAPLNHNTSMIGDPLKNPGGNPTLKSQEEWVINLVYQSNPIQVSCSIHPWMYARIWTFDHPFFAVTNEKGEFEIKNVPTGVEVGVVGWHEAREFFNGGKDGVKQKFNSGENKLDLKISAK